MYSSFLSPLKLTAFTCGKLISAHKIFLVATYFHAVFELRSFQFPHIASGLLQNASLSND